MQPNPDKRARRRRARARRSKNGWKQIDDFTFSKHDLLEIEVLWLEVNCPEATITYEKVPEAEYCPLFKKGAWNGKTHVVRFPVVVRDPNNYELKIEREFRSTWWSHREK